MLSDPVIFIHRTVGMFAMAMAAVAIFVGLWRRIELPKLSAALLGAGTILLAVAAGGPVWNRAKNGDIAVMVDLSPSTRGANYRKADFLRKRIAELIGNAPHTLIGFAAENRPLDADGPLDEMASDRTIFSPPAADAILLFSDARFELPEKSPPVDVAVDAGLENVGDAAVTRLEHFGNEISATISNTGPSRKVRYPGETGTAEIMNVPFSPIEKGTFIISRSVPRGDLDARVELNPGDLWPENDSLSIPISSPWRSGKWWIGARAASGWRFFSPGEIPTGADEYLGPTAIVIDNQTADGFSPLVLDRLMQYVRDLGGAILLVGGDKAFSSGGYSGSILEQLSPLESSPPRAMRRWVLLADASGSMSQIPAGGISRWQAATEAIIRLLPTLPPADMVQIGQFADSVHWWIGPTTAAEAAKSSLPPAGVFPHGPTNLESALVQIAYQSDAKLPTELVLISDCDAQISQAEQDAENLRAKQIHLHVLAIDRGAALGTIRKISAATGGTVALQFDPGQWAAAVRDICQSARPTLFYREPVDIRTIGQGRTIGDETARVWNRVWLKPDAELLADAKWQDVSVPMGARWQVGAGQVAALAFEPSRSQIEAWARLIARGPHDPRFSVHREMGSRIHVALDAIDGKKYLNDLAVALEIHEGENRSSVPLAQTGPGRYEMTMDAPARAQIGVLRAGDEIIDEFTLAAHYPAEFDAVGNDHTAMRALVDLSGGRMIWPGDHGRVDFRWPKVATPLGPWLCGGSFFLIGIGLIASVGRRK